MACRFGVAFPKAPGRSEACTAFAAPPERRLQGPSGFIRCCLLAGLIGLSACTIKGYPGPELEGNRIATVSRPSPSASWLFWMPPFWFPPLSLLLPKDENSLMVDRWRLNRLNDSVALLPGRHTARARRVDTIGKEYVGSRHCDLPVITPSRDKNKKLTCTRSVTCHQPVRVTQQAMLCELKFSVAAGQAYQIHLSDRTRLILTNMESGRAEDSSDCYWDEASSAIEDDSDTTTDSACE